MSNLISSTRERERKSERVSENMCTFSVQKRRKSRIEKVEKKMGCKGK